MPNAAIELTIARLFFWIEPVHHDAFTDIYTKRIVPLLHKHNLKNADETGRPTLAGVFSRLIEVATPAALIDQRQALEHDTEFTTLRTELGHTFGTRGTDYLSDAQINIVRLLQRAVAGLRPLPRLPAIRTGQPQQKPVSAPHVARSALADERHHRLHPFITAPHRRPAGRARTAQPAPHRNLGQ